MNAASGDTAQDLLSPGQVAETLGISSEAALDLMLTGGIRVVADEAGVPMVPVNAIAEYRSIHSGDAS